MCPSQQLHTCTSFGRSFAQPHSIRRGQHRSRRELSPREVLHLVTEQPGLQDVAQEEGCPLVVWQRRHGGPARGIKSPFFGPCSFRRASAINVCCSGVGVKHQVEVLAVANEVTVEGPRVEELGLRLPGGAGRQPEGLEAPEEAAAAWVVKLGPIQSPRRLQDLIAAVHVAEPRLAGPHLVASSRPLRIQLIQEDLDEVSVVGVRS
mmetsp:Transcript_49541/g.160064  ORF Transcript_49541/g.160064 Transcript_49541/m.160064 type:complete len:206 (-) Transcript_49541:308-925(-)